MSVIKIRMLISCIAEEKFFFQWELQNMIVSIETNFFYIS